MAHSGFCSEVASNCIRLELKGLLRFSSLFVLVAMLLLLFICKSYHHSSLRKKRLGRSGPAGKVIFICIPIFPTCKHISIYYALVEMVQIGSSQLNVKTRIMPILCCSILCIAYYGYSSYLAHSLSFCIIKAKLPVAIFHQLSWIFFFCSCIVHKVFLCVCACMLLRRGWKLTAEDC